MAIWVTFTVSVILSALFSGTEIAYLSANRLRLEMDRQKGSLGSQIIQIYLKRPNEFIATLLVGNNVVLVIYGMAMSAILSPLLTSLTTNNALLLTTETVISTIVILFLGEFFPKAIFKLAPYAILRIVAFPIFLLFILIYPLTYLISKFSQSLLRILTKGRTKEEKTKTSTFGRSDLNALVDTARLSAAQTKDEQNEYDDEVRIFQNALDFSELKVRECLVPRTDIEAIEVTESLQELTNRFIESNFSRLPVYQNSIDNIIGYANAKALFRNPTSIRDVIRPIDYIPETMPARKQLANFIRSSKSMAVVVDEFGGTAGIITIEDLIEEIFGEINDEHDTQSIIMKETQENVYLISGRAEVNAINEAFDLNIPEAEGYDTIAGFILDHQSDIPDPGEIITINHLLIKIIQVDGKRISLVQITDQR